ncbi:MAG: NUDIX hydrolase [Candidatus Poseidoniales archaeon]|jgi:8-oxo-dGTP diphosphatase|tara:strand:+ start:347 stop:841 length:495 start_codon:yes stop_codon:yes gene_type:complete
MGSTVCDLGVAARVVLDSKILLVKEARGSYQGKWSLPKGSVDVGEPPETAVLRELLEETGAGGHIIGLAAVRSTLNKDMPAVFLCYDVHVNTQINVVDTDEISESRWLALSELNSLDWASDTMHNLAIEALGGSRMSITSSKPLSKSGKQYYVYSVNKHSENLV